jgi:hypothetical protein
MNRKPAPDATSRTVCETKTSRGPARAAGYRGDLPGQIEMGCPAGDEDEVHWPVADDLIGDIGGAGPG